MSTHEVHVKRYWVVFAALAALTLLTVGVARLHLPMGWAITLALVIASVKAGLVAAYFMHLVSERAIIFAVLGVTVLFGVVLMALPTAELATHFHVP